MTHAAPSHDCPLCSGTGFYTHAPVPSDMAEDVKLVREALEEYADWEAAEPFDEDVKSGKPALAALARIVAHLSQNNSTVPRTLAADTSGLPDKGGLVAEDSTQIRTPDAESGEATPRVENLSPREAASSDGMEYGIEISGDDANRLAQCIDADYVINKIGTTRDKNRIGNIANLIRHYGHQARAEGLEIAAKECDEWAEVILYLKRPGYQDQHRAYINASVGIRALIPAGQQTKGDGK